ncbi:unnamed protein product [Cylicostephanus goldi]|uniref:Uncharacterized protein n=1 Tax=Cylicostephanus goldi TaxID=71465 RepID=A0A3P7M1C5_CYLGO|nr:unnamed protein product [Cylicostephanus goldi]
MIGVTTEACKVSTSINKSTQRSPIIQISTNTDNSYKETSVNGLTRGRKSPEAGTPLCGYEGVSQVTSVRRLRFMRECSRMTRALEGCAARPIDVLR